MFFFLPFSLFRFNALFPFFALLLWSIICSLYLQFGCCVVITQFLFFCIFLCFSYYSLIHPPPYIYPLLRQETGFRMQNKAMGEGQKGKAIGAYYYILT